MRLELAALLLGGALVVGCERPPMEVSQGDFRGLAVEQVQNPRIAARTRDANQVPDPVPPAAPGGPRASEVFQNLKVLGNLSAGEMTRVMAAMTTWVSPEQGCAYCHAGGNFAAEYPEAPYTKVVSRRMLQMTKHINADWSSHVGATGVTCYTCHRGMPVPASYWVSDSSHERDLPMVGYRAGQNAPMPSVGMASLPADPFTPFLLGEEEIRVQSAAALPADNRNTIKDAEWTYGFMMHFSTALGVNCTYCHNSRVFRSWEASSPTRVTAWYGIRMARSVNQNYIQPLEPVFPEYRKGPEGDPFKVHCATCHQGVAKPLYGVSMLKDYPELNAIVHAAARAEPSPGMARAAATSVDEGG